MEFNIEILQSVEVQTAITLFAIAATKIFFGEVQGNRNIKLPAISFVIGCIAAAVVAITPPELLPLLTTLSSLVTGTGSIGIAGDIAKKAKNEVVEVPVEFKPETTQSFSDTI